MGLLIVKRQAAVGRGMGVEAKLTLGEPLGCEFLGRSAEGKAPLAKQKNAVGRMEGLVEVVEDGKDGLPLLSDKTAKKG